MSDYPFPKRIYIGNLFYVV
uniref:Uncharacterized protein n=1 Tax=Anguilla anguilla TaxID=7936 RepID=A0A0E9PFY0_ANGAN